MKNKRNLFFGIAAALSLIVGFLSGQIFFDQQDVESKPIRAMVPDQPRKLAIPALEQADGGRLDMASLQGKWSLMFFGYTNCPDVCPMTLRTIAEAKKNSGQTDKQFPQVIFISVDPARDDVELLRDYVSYFDKDFIGATGEEKLLRAITVQMSSTFLVQPSSNMAEYMVDHSLNLALINPVGELVAILRPPHSIDSILDALKYFQS